MKALSVMPPWPFAIMHLEKDVENRGWNTSHRGPLAIHASKTWSQNGYEYISDIMDEHVPSEEHHVFGAIVGIVDLVDVVHDYDSGWAMPGSEWHWVIENPRELKQPIPFRGMLSLFFVPDRLLQGGFI